MTKRSVVTASQIKRGIVAFKQATGKSVVMMQLMADGVRLFARDATAAIPMRDESELDAVLTNYLRKPNGKN